MLSMRELTNTLKNPEIYDTKMELRNLSYEQLLEKVVGQKLWIKDLEKIHVDDLNEIVDLKIELEKTTSKYYLLKEENKQLQISMLALC